MDHHSRISRRVRRLAIGISVAALALVTPATPTADAAVLTPVVSAPATVTAGAADVPVVLRGGGFAGFLTVRSNSYDLTIKNVVRVSLTELHLTVTTHQFAALGPRSITITNFDTGTLTCDCINVTWAYRPATTTTTPNIVVINTDDQRWDSMSQLPQTDGRTDWARFPNSFVHEPQCCPSRATFFSGRYVQQHGVSTLRDGAKLIESSTIATLLHNAGYQTSMSGKYLNGWPFGRGLYRPPGWDDFRAFTGMNPTAPKDAKGTAIGYPYVNYRNIENATVVDYGTSAAEYSTDRFAAMTRAFLRKADPNRPVFAYFAPVAPHFTVRPADRDVTACGDLNLSLPATFNAQDTVSEPLWMSDLAPTSASGVRFQRIATCRALQSVDDAVVSFFADLQASGRLANTYVIYTSDNGYAFGEHRLTGKGQLYEDSIKVPLYVRGPGITGGTRNRLTSNVDLAPTIADMAQEPAPTGMFSGQSFLDDLKGTNTTPNPNWVLLFGCRTHVGVGDFCGGSADFMGQAWGVRTSTYKYVWYAQTGETQLFNLVRDPGELSNRTGDPAYATTKLALQKRLSDLLSTTGLIRGRVTDAATGLPMAALPVHIERASGAQLRDGVTDKNGRFAFLPLAIGDYKLRFDDPNTTLKWYGPAGGRDQATVIHVSSGITQITAALQRS